MIDLYELLEVSPRASGDVIAAAWRRLARTAHPDAGGDAERFVELEAAYATLSDPSKRASYDLERRRAAEDLASTKATRGTSSWSPPVWAGPEQEPSPTGHGVLSIWRGFEEHAAALLSFAPRPVGIAVCALGGFAVSEGVTRALPIALPDPAVLTRWIIAGVVTLLCALAGWWIGRRRSPVAWRRGVRVYALVLACLCAATVVELLIGLLPVLIIAAVIVLWIRRRHRARRESRS